MLNNWKIAACKLRVGVIGIKVEEDVNHFKRRQQRRTGSLEKKSKRRDLGPPKYIEKTQSERGKKSNVCK